MNCAKMYIFHTIFEYLNNVMSGRKAPKDLFSEITKKSKTLFFEFLQVPHS